MPTYEYQCDNGHEFEEFQSIVAEPVQVCPICGAKSTRKISGGTGLIFKGSGFYLTDYGRKKEPAKESTGETKPESKPAPSAVAPSSSGPDSGSS